MGAVSSFSSCTCCSWRTQHGPNMEEKEEEVEEKAEEEENLKM